MKHTPLAGSLLAAAALASCTTSQHPTEVLTVAASAPPASLDFTTTGGAAGPQALMGNVYETLVLIDDSGQPQPNLATSWETDGTTYTFHLRDDVTFSNGKPFTAEDAVFSICLLYTSPSPRD